MKIIDDNMGSITNVNKLFVKECIQMCGRTGSWERNGPSRCPVLISMAPLQTNAPRITVEFLKAVTHFKMRCNHTFK